jgi:hypothetical protein
MRESNKLKADLVSFESDVTNTEKIAPSLFS